MKSSLTVVLALAATGIAVPSAAAQSATLTTTQAARSARLAVDQNRSETARGVRCTKRGKLKAVCSARWRSGVQTFRGSVTITRTGTALSPVDTFRIRATGRARFLAPERIDERGRVIVETRRARVNQTLRLFGYDFAPDDIEITPVLAADPFVSPNEYSTPAAGTRFVAYTVNLRNVGKRRWTSGLYGFDAILQSGDAVDLAAAVGCDADADMAPGESRQACMAFEVPVGQAIRQLQLKVGSETGVWTP
jgi:hypothetical protein